MKRMLFLATAVAMSGCVSTSQEPIVGPSGKQILRAKCSVSSDGCLKKAAAVCKGPYQVLDSSSNSGGLVADILPGPVTWYSMSYQCGKTDGRMPAFPFRGQSYTPPARIAPTTTTCNSFGNSVTCNSY